VYCNNCRNVNKDNNKFCSNCGYPLTNNKNKLYKYFIIPMSILVILSIIFYIVAFILNKEYRIEKSVKETTRITNDILTFLKNTKIDVIKQDYIIIKDNIQNSSSKLEEQLVIIGELKNGKNYNEAHDYILSCFKVIYAIQGHLYDIKEHTDKIDRYKSIYEYCNTPELNENFELLVKSYRSATKVFQKDILLSYIVIEPHGNIKTFAGLMEVDYRTKVLDGCDFLKSLKVNNDILYISFDYLNINKVYYLANVDLVLVSIQGGNIGPISTIIVVVYENNSITLLHNPDLCFNDLMINIPENTIDIDIGYEEGLRKSSKLGINDILKIEKTRDNAPKPLDEEHCNQLFKILKEDCRYYSINEFSEAMKGWTNIASQHPLVNMRLFETMCVDRKNSNNLPEYNLFKQKVCGYSSK